MRVRAAARAASFCREGSLTTHHAEAGELVRTLKAQAKADPELAQRRADTARLRAAEPREQRIQDALARLRAMSRQRQAASTSTSIRPVSDLASIRWIPLVEVISDTSAWFRDSGLVVLCRPFNLKRSDHAFFVEFSPDPLDNLPTQIQPPLTLCPPAF